MTTNFTRTLGDLAVRRAGGLRAAAFATVALGALGGCAFLGLPETSAASWEYCRNLPAEEVLDAIERGDCAPAAGGLAMRFDAERERFGPEEHENDDEPTPQREPDPEPEETSGEPDPEDNIDQGQS